MLTQVDYERMQENPNGYFKETAELFANQLKEVNEQIRALNGFKALLSSKSSGKPLTEMYKKLLAAALKSQHGSLDDALGKFDKNIEIVKNLQDKLRELGNEFGEINSNAILQGNQNKELDNLIQTIRNLDKGYSDYQTACQETKPLVEKYLPKI